MFTCQRCHAMLITVLYVCSPTATPSPLTNTLAGPTLYTLRSVLVRESTLYNSWLFCILIFVKFENSYWNRIPFLRLLDNLELNRWPLKPRSATQVMEKIGFEILSRVRSSGSYIIRDLDSRDVRKKRSIDEKVIYRHYWFQNNLKQIFSLTWLFTKIYNKSKLCEDRQN